MDNKTRFIEKLRALIKDGDEVDRSYAIRTLAKLKDSDSVELLFECLHDEDLDVSIDAVNALGELQSDAIADKLIDSFIHDPEGEVKVACLESLAKLGDKKAIPYFLSTAEKPPEETSFSTGDWDLWWDMQLQSIRGLAALKAKQAIPVLRKLIESDDYLDIENEIFNAIVDIGGSKSEGYLLSLLTDGSARIRRRVAKALGRSQSKATLKLLGRALRDKDADVREATLYALQQRHASQYLPAVILLFRDVDAKVRQTAVNVANKLSQQDQQDNSSRIELTETLTPLLRDADPLVKTTVLKTLMGLGWQANEEELAYLSGQLKNCSGDCFGAMCDLVVKQQIADGFANLLYLLRHNELDTEEKIHALSALGKSGQWNTAIESTIGALLFDKESVVRLTALEALAELDKGLPQKMSYKGRLPIDIISEALQGQLAPPASQKIIPIVPVEELDKKFAEKERNKQLNEVTEPGSEDSSEFVDQALEQISQSISQGEKPHPLSTLDAIAISHVEDQLEQQAADGTDSIDIEDDLPQNQDEDVGDFIALTEHNKEISRWLFNKESVDVSVDIRRLAARIIGQAGSDKVVPILLEALTADDKALKREAALSVADFYKQRDTERHLATASSNDNNDIARIQKALLSALNDDERDLRIAAARALAEVGSVAEVPALIEKLFDDDVAMRMQTLQSLSKIACRDDVSTEASEKTINTVALAELMLDQLENNEIGIHRAAVEALIPLFNHKLNGATEPLKHKAISRLIQAGLSGTHGQVKEMSWGLNALDKDLSSMQLLEKIDEVSNSIERRYMVEMLGELHGHEA